MQTNEQDLLSQIEYLCFGLEALAKKWQAHKAKEIVEILEYEIRTQKALKEFIIHPNKWTKIIRFNSKIQQSKIILFKCNIKLNQIERDEK